MTDYGNLYSALSGAEETPKGAVGHKGLSDPTHGTADGIVAVYDGIEEMDNHLPRWWLAIFFGSIVFAFGYWFLFETTGLALNPGEVFAQEMAEIEKTRAKSGQVTDTGLLALAKDGEVVTSGQATFKTMCAACHGQKGEGLVGPNLTDKFWIHGSAPTNIYKMIDVGVPTKGMPAWGPMLGATRVREVTAYLLTLKNTNVPGKPPQGEPAE